MLEGEERRRQVTPGVAAVPPGYGVVGALGGGDDGDNIPKSSAVGDWLSSATNSSKSEKSRSLSCFNSWRAQRTASGTVQQTVGAMLSM